MLTSDGFSKFSEHALLELLNDIRANPLIGFPWGTDIFGIPTDSHHVPVAHLAWQGQEFLVWKIH